MPYEVTAARKRPQSFEQLAGQEFVAATLEKSLETGRIAHAYLFSGPRGCGKTSTARILAKALNCEKGLGAQPCGACDSCAAIAAGSSLDVIEIDGASNTSVENVRQIKDEVLFPPNGSRYKIYIIDEVHMLSTSAFNALLKTIEEPPPYVIFMFATTEPHKVPATIKSRCQQFTFRLVSPEVIVELLAAAASEIDVAAEPEALLWIARESGGSVRDAYTLFDQVVSFAEGKITAALIREKLGLVGQDRMNALFGLFVAGDTAGALAALDSILGGGVSPEQFVADSVEYCRALLLIKNGITRESVLGAPLSSFDLGITEALSGDRIERVLSIFLGAYRNLKESIDPRYELDLAVAKTSHIGEYVQSSDIVRAVGTLRRYLEKNAPAAPVVRQGEGGRAQTVLGGHGAAGGGLSQPAPDSARSTAAPRNDAAAAGSAGGTASTPGSAPAVGNTSPRAPASDNQIAGAAVMGPLDPAKLPEIKKALVADIRKSNVLLATTLEKSRSWRLRGDTLSMEVSTRMEYDLLRRFLGIIAELLAQRSGWTRKIEVLLAGEDAEGEADSVAGDSPFEAPGLEAGSSSQEGRGPIRETSIAAGGESRLPGAFNERSGDSEGRPQGGGIGRQAAGDIGRQAAGDIGRGPAVLASPSRPSAQESESIALVERLFKGKMVGISSAKLSASTNSTAQTGPAGPESAAFSPAAAGRANGRGASQRTAERESPAVSSSLPESEPGSGDEGTAIYSPESDDAEMSENELSQ